MSDEVPQQEVPRLAARMMASYRHLLASVGPDAAPALLARLDGVECGVTLEDHATLSPEQVVLALRIVVHTLQPSEVVMVCVGDTLDSQSNETLGQMMLTSYEGTNGQRHQFGCPFVWAEGVPSFDLGDEGAFCLDDVLPTLRGATAEDFAAAERQPETLAAATALTRGLADIVGQRRASAKS